MKDLRISWKAIFKYGLVLSVLFTLLVLGSYMNETMIWAADFPKEVQEQIGEIPPEAIPKGWGVFVLIMGMCIVFPVLMNKSIFEKRQKKATFLELLLNGFLLLNVMNLFDLLVVDLLIFHAPISFFGIFQRTTLVIGYSNDFGIYITCDKQKN